MTMFLLSPAERDPMLLTIGRVSPIPERYGADILWHEPVLDGLIGVQRKTVEDLVASVGDGRLAKEVQQMEPLKLAVLCVEGRPRWTPDGMLVHRFTRYTRAQHRSLLRSMQHRGIIVEHSDDPADTAALCYEVASWAHKSDHTSLDRRPKPIPDRWGTRSSKSWALHMLQSVPGLGPKQAEVVYDHFGGKVPIALTCTVGELSQVKGLGPKRVKAIVEAFGPGESDTKQVNVLTADPVTGVM